MFLSNSTVYRLTKYGTGSPESVVTSNVGGLYIQTDASPISKAIWFKATGTGNTGWTQLTAAPLASPALTGTPTAPTAAANTNTTQIATTAYVQTELTDLINGAPGILDTLEEIADALGDDANFAATMTTALALKAPLASPTLTGNPLAPTQSPGTNNTRIATTAYADAAAAAATSAGVADGDKGDIVVASGVWSFDTGVVTAFAKTMLDDAAASNVRTTLGLGTAALISSTAGGDLAGTLPSPTVAKITETSGPTTLTIGTLTDGQFLKRVGSTLVSAAIVAGATVTIATTAPGSPAAGDLWWNSEEGTLKVYYNDGSSSQWVDASPLEASPSGAASGSLAGTYPSPTIASSVSLPGSPTTTTQSGTDSSTKVATTAQVQAALAKQAEILEYSLSDETTTITTGTAKLTTRAPFAMTVTAVRASLTTVSSSGIPTVDINEGGTTILSTKLTIDASEFTSTTAATAAVISDSAIADDAELTVDIDVAGTGAKGLKVRLYVTRA